MKKIFIITFIFLVSVFAQSTTPLPGQTPPPTPDTEPTTLQPPNTKATGTIVLPQSNNSNINSTDMTRARRRALQIAPSTTLPTPTTPNTPRPPDAHPKTNVPNSTSPGAID